MDNSCVFPLTFLPSQQFFHAKMHLFFDRESFCSEICGKKRHSRKFTPLISRFFPLPKLSACESFCRYSIVSPVAVLSCPVSPVCPVAVHGLLFISLQEIMVMLLETVSTIQITFEEISKSKGRYFACYIRCCIEKLILEIDI